MSDEKPIVLDVRLHTVIQQQTPDGPRARVTITLPSGSTLDDLIRHLNIDFDRDSLLLVINGRWAEEDQVLADGDRVDLIPAISGG